MEATSIKLRPRPRNKFPSIKFSEGLERKSTNNLISVCVDKPKLN